MTLTQGTPQQRRTLSQNSKTANYLFSEQLLIKAALPSGRNTVLAKQPCPKRTAAYGKTDVFPAQKDFPLGSCLLFQVRQTFYPLTMDIFSPLTPQETGDIQRDLVTKLVIFTFLEDRNKGAFLLQRQILPPLLTETKRLSMKLL